MDDFCRKWEGNFIDTSDGLVVWGELVKRALKNGSQVFNLHNWLAVGDIKKHWEKPRFINRIDNYSDEISSEQLKHVIL